MTTSSNTLYTENMKHNILYTSALALPFREQITGQFEQLSYRTDNYKTCTILNELYKDYNYTSVKKMAEALTNCMTAFLLRK